MSGDFNYRFSSEYLDVETGLVYYNYRFFSPELGRWMARDMIEEEGGGINLYGIVRNNLVNLWDLMGAGLPPPGWIPPPEGLGLDNNLSPKEIIPEEPCCCCEKPKVTLKIFQKAVGKSGSSYFAEAKAGYENPNSCIIAVHWAWATCHRFDGHSGFFNNGLDSDLDFLAGHTYGPGANYLVRAFFVITYCDPKTQTKKRAVVSINDGVNYEEPGGGLIGWLFGDYTYHWGNPSPESIDWEL